MYIKELKLKAKDSLAFNRWQICGVMFLHNIITLLIGIIPFVGLLVTPQLALGESFYFLKCARKQYTTVEDSFSGFKNYGKALGLMLLMTLYIFLWSLLLVVPGIIKSFAYSQAFYILAENPEISVTDALKESENLMKGHKWELFVLMFSFLGWAILSGLTLGILGYLYVGPYVANTITHYYLELTKQNPNKEPLQIEE